ncbi:MAG: hypothetical protein Ct9H90mP13_10120 [Pseudomonadota bacterium]|nr:MAG: hypothetical protein Ct9H90mP13_10120 [Pseudomonadota bacterium]
MGTHGWNSTEILVQNPDQLATELESSAFEIIGMPYDLYPHQMLLGQCRFWAHLMKFYI